MGPQLAPQSSPFVYKVLLFKNSKMFFINITITVSWLLRAYSVVMLSLTIYLLGQDSYYLVTVNIYFSY